VRTSLAGLVAALVIITGLPAVANAAQPPAVPAPTAPTHRDADTVAARWRESAPATVIVGRSVLGRAIVAHRTGPAGAPKVLLVVGQMHGTETKGRAVVADLSVLPAPAGVQVWTISTMNPDGAAARRRTNAHGVDLNRNFPDRWRPAYSSRALYFPGRAAATEPEVVAMMAFLDVLRPDLVVSLHQHHDAVDLGAGRVRVWSLRLSQALHLRAVVVPCDGPCSGTMTGWFNAHHPGAALTVELPAAVPTTLATSYARAIRAVGALLVAA
jgi:murein peptide amidase A